MAPRPNCKEKDMELRRTVGKFVLCLIAAATAFCMLAVIGCASKDEGEYSGFLTDYSLFDTGCQEIIGTGIYSRGGTRPWGYPLKDGSHRC